MKSELYYETLIANTRILFTNDDDKHCQLSHFLLVLKACFSPGQVSAAATPSSSSVNRGKGNGPPNTSFLGNEWREKEESLTTEIKRIRGLFGSGRTDSVCSQSFPPPTPAQPLLSRLHRPLPPRAFQRELLCQRWASHARVLRPGSPSESRGCCDTESVQFLQDWL